MNQSFCKMEKCIEPRLGRSSFCRQHHGAYCRALYRQRRAEHQAWVDSRRECQIRELLAASTPSERAAIQRGRRQGRRLRRELESAAPRSEGVVLPT
ncbi:MAG: hypothetical protein ACYTEK_06510 [Planctomycetota bacterium]|jgi:hypothetical protein